MLDRAGRRSPSDSSALMIVQTFALPVRSDDPSSHVSAPGSPRCAMVWKVQRSLPVRASNPRTSPGAPACRRTGSRTDEPTITTPRLTIGGEVTEYSALLTGRRRPTVRSTRPASPNDGIGRPVRASSAMRCPSPVPANSRSSLSVTPVGQPAVHEAEVDRLTRLVGLRVEGPDRTDRSTDRSRQPG